jgi:hypothetical protein
VRDRDDALAQDSPGDAPGWVFEEKVDGWRVVAYKAGEDVC